jgi:hypothetical protein
MIGQYLLNKTKVVLFIGLKFFQHLNKALILSYSSILYIILYPLWGSLITLFKYIYMTSCFEVFIETNLMVQSKFNLVI